MTQTRIRKRNERDLVKMIVNRTNLMLDSRQCRGSINIPIEPAPLWRSSSTTVGLGSLPAVKPPGTGKHLRSTSGSSWHRDSSTFGEDLYFPSVSMLHRSQSDMRFASTWSGSSGAKWHPQADRGHSGPPTCEGGWLHKIDALRRENQLQYEMLDCANSMAPKLKYTSSVASTGESWRQRAILDSSLCPAVVELRVNATNIANDLRQHQGRLQSSSMPSRTLMSTQSERQKLRTWTGDSTESQPKPQPLLSKVSEQAEVAPQIQFFTSTPQSMNSLSVAEALQGVLVPSQSPIHSRMASKDPRVTNSVPGSAATNPSRQGTDKVEEMGDFSSVSRSISKPSPSRSVSKPQNLRRVSQELNCPYEDIKVAWSLFEKYNRSGHGELEKHEFTSLQMEIRAEELAQLSEGEKQHKLESAWLEADRNGNGAVDFEEFAGWFNSQCFSTVYLLSPDERRCRELAKKYNLSVAEVDAAKMKFDKFDLDGSGEIEFDEFEKLLYQMLKIPKHLDLPQSRIKAFWTEVDLDGSGGVDFEEFLQWYTKYFDLGGRSQDISPIEQFYASFRQM